MMVHSIQHIVDVAIVPLSHHRHCLFTSRSLQFERVAVVLFVTDTVVLTRVPDRKLFSGPAESVNIDAWRRQVLVRLGREDVDYYLSIV